MATDARVGRLLGLLLALHFVFGLILPYVLLDSSMASPGTVADGAAARAANLRMAVALFVLAAALVLAIAITAWPVFRRHSERLALAFLALAVANLPLQLVESASVLTILSLSNEAGATAGAAAALARRWVHFAQLLTVVSWLFVLYLTLWRTALVPRLLAALGMMTTLLQIGGVPARAMLGLSLVMELAMPLAPVHAALALWLIVKGLRS